MCPFPWPQALVAVHGADQKLKWRCWNYWLLFYWLLIYTITVYLSFSECVCHYVCLVPNGRKRPKNFCPRLCHRVGTHLWLEDCLMNRWDQNRTFFVTWEAGKKKKIHSSIIISHFSNFPSVKHGGRAMIWDCCAASHQHGLPLLMGESILKIYHWFQRKI